MRGGVPISIRNSYEIFPLVILEVPRVTNCLRLLSSDVPIQDISDLFVGVIHP